MTDKIVHLLSKKDVCVKVCFWFCGFERSVLVQFQVFNLHHIFSLILEWCNKMDMTQVWILIIWLPNVSCKCQWKNNTSNSKTCLWLCELWFQRLNCAILIWCIYRVIFLIMKMAHEEPKSHKRLLSLLISCILTNSLLPFQKHTHCGLNWIWQYIEKTPSTIWIFRGPNSISC
jgi:branched-subunit amino acid transport protein